LIGSGFLALLSGNVFNGIWAAWIGWFLLNGARSADSRAALEYTLRGVTVGQVMKSSPVTVPGSMPVQELVDDVLLLRGSRSVFVMEGDQLVGLITLSDIRHAPREQWRETLVLDAMTPLERLHVVAPQQNLNEVLPLMAGQDINQLPVLMDGHLVGVLSREDVIRYIEVRRGLGQAAAGQQTSAQTDRRPTIATGPSTKGLAGRH
jgi:CBS domain-containing protein